MADEQANKPSRTDDYRKAISEYLETRFGLRDNSVEYQIEASFQSCVVALWSIAGELAEMNSRDREAEVRAKNAELFVAGMQEELRRQGIVMSASMPNVKPPRGK